MSEERLGLTAEDVALRVAEGAVNVDAGVKTRSVRQIVVENVCTLFNLINVVLALFVLITGSYKNMLFMGVIVCNTLIGIVQEVRSKKTTDALSIVASSKATVLRDGVRVELPLDQLVRDDVIELGRGDQVPADAVVVSGACDANESLLTGESKLVKKTVGDELMSGSFVNAGVAWARVVHVGAENYAAKISAEAKRRKAVNSEIMNSLNGIIKFVSFVIFPLGALLFAREHLLSGTEFNSAVLSTVSALVGMIPEGLILLTSTVLAVAVVRLSKNRVLVQQLYCIETLARVDTLCLDKTGTITTGKMEVVAVECVPGADEAEADAAFASLARADEDPNDTALAILDHYAGSAVKSYASTRAIPFSSDKKWSGATFADGRSYVMGAGQFVLGDAFSQVEAQQNALAGDARVLLLARVDGFDDEGAILGSPVAIGFVAIHDQIRATAAQTIGYFKEQGVDLKVLSGDDPRTVSGIARKVGVPRADEYVDAASLTDDASIAAAIERYSVFGRVKPEQKKAFVLALQERGHVVAMTGDGGERHACAQAIGLQRGYGCRVGCCAQRGAAGAGGQRFRRHAEGGGRGATLHQQPAAVRFAVPGENAAVHDACGAVHLIAVAVSVPAHPDDAHQRVHYRHSVVRAGARAEQGPHQRAFPRERDRAVGAERRVRGAFGSGCERCGGTGFCASATRRFPPCACS
ncbi:HAD-IC family P-type ATPase [Paraeggerthella sp.]|uniref:HAD-IC family P-type ATPase n=1 Tax=Paraeggerthella sp. TaxID=2897350 RepID=UPI00352795C7